MKILALFLCLTLFLSACSSRDAEPEASLTDNTAQYTSTNPSDTSDDTVFTPVTTEDAVKYSHQISIGTDTLVALRADGTAFCTSTSSNKMDHSVVSEWTDLIAVASHSDMIFGVKKDGSLLVSQGKDWEHSWDYNHFTDLRYVECTGMSIYGLKNDGTVVASGPSERVANVSHWTDVVQLSVSGDAKDMVLGLKSDGTVLVAGADYVGGASEWTDIVQVSAGRYHALGLKSDGTVVSVGKNHSACIELSDWADIVFVSGSNMTTYALKADGTVVCRGAFEKESYASWTDVISITHVTAGGENYIYGVTGQGKLRGAGDRISKLIDDDPILV